MDKELTSNRAQSRLRADQVEALRAFAAAILGEAYEFGGGDIDGGWLQDKGVETGVIVKVHVEEPCSEDHCACAEWDDFPQECYRIAPFVLVGGEEGEDGGH